MSITATATVPAMIMTEPMSFPNFLLRAFANHGSIVPQLGQKPASELINDAHMPQGISLGVIKILTEFFVGLYINPFRNALRIGYLK